MSDVLAPPSPPTEAGRKPRISVTALLGNAMVRIVLVALAAITLTPIAFMVWQSVRSQDGNSFTLASWKDVFGTSIVHASLVSFQLAAVSIVVGLLFGSTAAFAFAKLRFPGSQSLSATVIALLLLPVQSYVITAYFNYAHLDLIGNVLAVGVLFGAIHLPFGIFVLTNFYRSISSELIEAGLLDGASYPQVFFRIFLPLSKPALVTVCVLNFINVWNDLLISLLFLPAGDSQPVSVAIASTQVANVFDVHLVMAGSILSAIPGIVIYLIFQKEIAVGLTMGTGK